MASLLILLALAVQDAPRAGIAAWDTGTESAQRLALDTVPNPAWRKTDAGASLQGDLVITNGRLLAVARRQGAGLELYSLRSGKPLYRSTLQLAPNPLEKIALTEAGRGAAVVELSWKGASARFRLPKGEHFVE